MSVFNSKGTGMVRFRPRYLKDYFWKSKARNIFAWIIELIIVVVLAFVCTYAFGQQVVVADDAMEPTFHVGDKVLINKTVKLLRTIKRGDMIAYRTGNDENAAIEVRRVIGLPGETVQIRDGRIYINGELYEEGRDFPVIVYPGLAEEEVYLGGTEYFVLGDSRNNSEDSRHVDIGNVDRDLIRGTVWLKLDPVSRVR